MQVFGLVCVSLGAFFCPVTPLPGVFAVYHALCVNCQCQCHWLCIYSNWVDFAIYNLAGWLPLFSSQLTVRLCPFHVPSGQPQRHPAVLAVYYYTAHLTSPSMAYRINSSGSIMFASHDNMGNVQILRTYFVQHQHIGTDNMMKVCI